MAEASFAQGRITEIKAFARGAIHLFPGCRTVIDIEGQDTKVIALDDEGIFIDFEMNDRCAAGSGRFLEIMAQRSGFDIKEAGHPTPFINSLERPC